MTVDEGCSTSAPSELFWTKMGNRNVDRKFLDLVGDE